MVIPTPTQGNPQISRIRTAHAIMVMKASSKVVAVVVMMAHGGSTQHSGGLWEGESKKKKEKGAQHEVKADNCNEC